MVAGGTASHSLAFPNDPTLTGAALFTQVLVIDAAAMPDIDYTGAQTLAELGRELRGRARTTLVGGRIVFENGRLADALTSSPG